MENDNNYNVFTPPDGFKPPDWFLPPDKFRNDNHEALVNIFCFVDAYINEIRNPGSYFRYAGCSEEGLPDKDTSILLAQEVALMYIKDEIDKTNWENRRNKICEMFKKINEVIQC